MRRGLLAVIAAALAIMAAAAVLSSRGGSSALSLDPVAAAATKTQAAGSARIRMALALSGPQLPGGTVNVKGTGAIDGASSEFTFNMGPRGSMKEISVEQNGDYVLYLRVPQLSAQLGGKQWVEIDISKLGESAGLDLSKLMSGSQLQPSDMLSMLTAEGATVRRVGAATVNGIATTHYRVVIDTEKALKAKGLTSPLLAGIASTLPSSIPADVWVGKDGLVRRVQVSLSAAQSQMNMTMDLDHYGAHVSIAAPASSDVFDATALAQQGIAGGLH